MKSLSELLHSATQNTPRKLVVAAAADLHVLLAIHQAYISKLITPILVGDAKLIQFICEENGIDCSNFEIINEPDSVKAAQASVKLINEQLAEILMKGLLPTAQLLKAVVAKDNGLRKDRVLSHFALFESPYYSKLIGVTDAAMNIAPTLEDKVEIVRNAVNVLHQLGYENPKVAILAPLESVNEKIRSSVDAAKLKEMNRAGVLKGCIIDGPLALDNAVSPEAAKHKGITGDVAGNADLLIVPELNSGNVLYKSLIFLGGAKSAAVIVGTKVPIVLTSRADSEESKLFSIALASKLYNFSST